MSVRQGVVMLLPFTVEQRVAVSAATVWELVDDFGAHDRFNPFIERSRVTNEITSGEGSEREILLYDGSLVRQRIVDYQPGRSMVIEVIDDDPLLRHHVVEISVIPRSAESCMLAYRVSFQAPGGLAGWPIGLLRRTLLRSRYRHLLRGVDSRFRQASAVDR